MFGNVTSPWPLKTTDVMFYVSYNAFDISPFNEPSVCTPVFDNTKELPDSSKKTSWMNTLSNVGDYSA